jgi:phosphoenolpyruvate carboxykinase (ATP)
MNFAQELTPEQAVLAYLWGESTHSYASQPLKAGESVRIVGTDPFIVGSRAKKVNRFYEIIMTLVNNYPGKLKFMQYNTGGMGEIIETAEENGKKKKRLIRKVNRVPINLMASIQRGDLRGTNQYEKGRLGTKEIVRCEGKSLDDWDIQKLYSAEQIQDYIRNLVDGRRKFTEEIAAEGLRQEILYAAERSFRIDKSGKGTQTATPEADKGEPEEEEKPIFRTRLKTRPRRDRLWRGR